MRCRVYLAFGAVAGLASHGGDFHQMIDDLRELLGLARPQLVTGIAHGARCMAVGLLSPVGFGQQTWEGKPNARRGGHCKFQLVAFAPRIKDRCSM